MINQLHRWIDALATLPGIADLRRARYRQFFRDSTNRNLFCGVYPSYELAQRSAPESRPLGYDNDASVRPYEGRLSVFPNDYPAMFWLAQSFEEGATSVADLGGSVGIKFMAFQMMVKFPDRLVWTVIDVPAAVKRGREIAEARGVARQLRFSEQIEDVGSAEVLLASGSIQYLPDSVHTLLGRLENRPRRVIINTAALHPTTTYYTVNSIGTAFCPYRIQSEIELVDGMKQIGYSLRDRWRNLERRIDIPFEDPRYSLDHYSGLCFDQADD